MNALPKSEGKEGEPGEGEKEGRERGRVSRVRGRKKEGREGELGEGEKEERDLLCMGTVHDDEAIHQFRVPLHHTPEERETVH